MIAKRFGPVLVGIAAGVAISTYIHNLRGIARVEPESPGLRIDFMADAKTPEFSSPLIQEAPPQPPEDAGPTEKDAEYWNAKFRASARSRHVNALLNAGFSTDRIEWLMRRSAELHAQRQAASNERRAKGEPFDLKSFVAWRDGERELREEMGNVEYERYLEALGRPVGAVIRSVEVGSAVERAGLMRGDQIVSFDGQRVFNSWQMAPVVESGPPTGLAQIEIRRQGQSMFVTVPRNLPGARIETEQPFTLGEMFEGL